LIRGAWAGAACVLTPAAAGPAGAGAATAVPAWSITAISYPTNFVPLSDDTGRTGPAYFVMATNVGGAATTGTFTITDTLPTGLTPSTAEAPSGVFGREKLPNKNEHEFTCNTVGQTITCTGSAPGVNPGEYARVTIPLKVTNAAPATVTNQISIAGGGAPLPASASVETSISATPAAFGILPGTAGLFAKLSHADGSAAEQAGSHPYNLSIGLGIPTLPAEEAGQEELYAPDGGLRDGTVVLPPGLVADPSATPKCKEVELESAAGCPPDSQVGTVNVPFGVASMAGSVSPLFNMKASPGSPGEFGFEFGGLEGTYIHLRGHVRSDGKYELAAGATDAIAKAGVFGIQTNFWGMPSDSSHDAQRGKCFAAGVNGVPPEALCPFDESGVLQAFHNRALITMPSSCSGPMSFTASVDSWISPTVQRTREAVSTNLADTPVAVTGCGNLAFSPTIAIQPDNTNADSPSGLSAHLHVPQNEEYEGEAGEPKFAEATLRDAKVVLPAGVSVNPSAANGRTACAPAQIGLITPVGQETDVHFRNEPASCPDNAKIGTVKVLTPLLQDEPLFGVQQGHPLTGSIYLASPYQNPFGSLLGIYIAVSDPETNVVIKLAGKVEADPVTGQLTTTFRENPQLPFEDFELEFTGGARAALRTPITCGGQRSQSELTSWASPTPVVSFEPFPVDHGAGGGACATSVDKLPNQPSLEAGTTSPLAGTYSPFVMKLSRADGTQEFGALNVTLPEGLTGKLAGTPYCPDSAIAAAALKSGREEEASPSCPAASEVGTVTVGAGAGSQPFYARGIAYLAGPYKGAPLSLAIVTPAVAGPYDLGDVVVRAALSLNLYTSQITVKSDPLPTILKGIPLDVRSIAVQIGKSDFTLNPTSCEPMTLGAESISTTGQVAHLSTHFQVSGCKQLKFKPKLELSLKGPTKRSGHPALKAVVTYPKKGAYANIARAQVSLPHSEFLDQNNLNKVCTQAQLTSDTCPAKSIYGHAKAWTPLLEKPLEGPVYLGVGFGYKLPALVADLNGQVRILLKGKVDTSKKHGIRNTFEAVPDAPVSKFVLEMKGGKNYGLLENSENICLTPQHASAEFTAQNGLSAHLTPLIANSCKSGKGKKKRHKRHH
jgi:hypothetical protein